MDACHSSKYVKVRQLKSESSEESEEKQQQTNRIYCVAPSCSLKSLFENLNIFFKTQLEGDFQTILEMREILFNQREPKCLYAIHGQNNKDQSEMVERKKIWLKFNSLIVFVLPFFVCVVFCFCFLFGFMCQWVRVRAFSHHMNTVCVVYAFVCRMF